ncbi:glycosyltransferase family 39 protein [Acidiphilium sp. PA]|uniref:glycosyltransferase family 39 protein n=1 Tax=Acidiphilium sp. PA TaxID=2871705 RepID=UPI002243248B|nr:glycosyltransferase family 39 protein [Acidiphilium sp. PA]MCW8307172.1 glycosyltransferase family 39 protein [Acidiphilium sp. PA]
MSATSPRARIRIAAALGSAALILLIIAWCRGGEYDEYYSIFLIAGDPRPHWPVVPVRVMALRGLYHGHAGLLEIVRALRRGDVHPPLYFWLLSVWRDLVGMTLFRLRMLSIILTLLALATLARIARRLGVAPARTIVLTVLCYGFAYTGVVARNFALADLLSLTGVVLLLKATAPPNRPIALLGGFALGAACFSNYLASFTTIAALGWFAIINRRHPLTALLPALGAASLIPAGAWFFLAQAESRKGQFHAFKPFRALIELGRDQAGAVLGALPRYAPPPVSIALAAALGALAVLLAALVIRDGLPRLAPHHRGLVGSLILAPPLGLLALGAAFDNTPIEVRYVWLGLPYIGLALAAAVHNRPRLAALLITVQAAAIAGLAIAPQTMQPARRTARTAAALAGADALVLVPFGNDGVGIPGPFIAAAPSHLLVQIVRAATPALPAATARFHRIVIANIQVDTASRTLIPQLVALFSADPCRTLQRSPADVIVFDNHCQEPQ